MHWLQDLGCSPLLWIIMGKNINTIVPEELMRYEGISFLQIIRLKMPDIAINIYNWAQVFISL